MLAFASGEALRLPIRHEWCASSTALFLELGMGMSPLTGHRAGAEKHLSRPC